MSLEMQVYMHKIIRLKRGLHSGLQAGSSINKVVSLSMHTDCMGTALDRRVRH